jgi:serine protease Do
MEMNMKLHNNFRIWIALVVLGLAILACGPTVVNTIPTDTPPVQPTPNSQIPTPSNINQSTVNRADLIKATVQILMAYNVNGKLTPKYQGSGTIISSMGMILTNAHVASPASQGEPDIEPDALVIGLVVQEDKPPVFSYIAKVKAVDGFLDLAVIQISSTLDGTNVDPNSLNLPFVKLGNSDDLHVGDPIDVIGFPVIGGETITFTTGNVSGFTQEAGLGDRAWIKTDAAISGGNSGGLGASAAGFIIGVPTKLGSGTGSNFVDCRIIADTNGDGVIDEKDNCVPAGEFLNALRSINLALPLIKAAQSGVAYVSPFGEAPTPPQPPSNNETFGTITWYSADSNCKLQDPVSAFPSGPTAMAAAFSFNGMTDGEPWAEKWTVNGQVLYETQSKPETWGMGSQGNTYTCLFNNTSGMPDGDYHIELYGGQGLTLLIQSDVVVGNGSGPVPNPPSNKGVITVSGQVVDGDSMNPLPGAEIYVLNPGISFDQWKTDQGALTDVLTSAKADNQGNFSVPDKLALNISYSVVFYAEGYKLKVYENQTFDSKTPVNLELLIKMTK